MAFTKKYIQVEKMRMNRDLESKSEILEFTRI